MEVMKLFMPCNLCVEGLAFQLGTYPHGVYWRALCRAEMIRPNFFSFLFATGSTTVIPLYVMWFGLSKWNSRGTLKKYLWHGCRRIRGFPGDSGSKDPHGAGPELNHAVGRNPWRSDLPIIIHLRKICGQRAHSCLAWNCKEWALTEHAVAVWLPCPINAFWRFFYLLSHFIWWFPCFASLVQQRKIYRNPMKVQAYVIYNKNVSRLNWSIS